MDVEDCFNNEINPYYDGEKTGHVLLVNAQNYNTFREILDRLRTSNQAKIICVSDHCPGEDMVPNLDDLRYLINGKGHYALVGLSQTAMLHSSKALREMIDELLEFPISGHAVILLEHSASIIRDFMARNKKVGPRVVLVDGKDTPLPRIHIAKTREDCFGSTPIIGIKRLIYYLENLTDLERPKDSEGHTEDQIELSPEVTVVTHFSTGFFSNAVYSVSACDSAYSFISDKYPDIANATQENYGTEEQWRKLASLLEKAGSLSSLSREEFGKLSDYSMIIGKVWNSNDSFREWFLWLCVKVFGENTNKYLSLVVQNSESVSDFEGHLYKDLLDIDVGDPNFGRYYDERKNIITEMPENLPLIDSYCSMVGRRERQAVYYLTDTSDKEKYELMNCLSKYDYSEDELLKITENNFRPLYLYLLPFKFTSANTSLADESLRDEFTDYFRKYKLQKLTNRIHPDFLSTVERYAVTRPYNNLPARSTVISKMPAEIKNTAQLFFFDALGVEYLSYIMEKCGEYNLVAELSIGHASLPSITACNKEFTQYFKLEAKKIDDLDELKHHSQVIDYTKCKVPVHLFAELSIIDEELRKIQSQLVQGIFERAVVVADHGASRLAVISGMENPSSLSLDEKAGHSGRCCQVGEDPKIPYAAYDSDSGFVSLANYTRFKGGRKANVEVHGGATLEEVLVPIITISRKPENLEICFVNPLIELHGRETAVITLFSNIPLKNPRLNVNGKFYEGTFSEDERHVKFELPELRRTRDCLADVYDGDALLVRKLQFRVQRDVAKDNLQL